MYVNVRVNIRSFHINYILEYTMYTCQIVCIHVRIGMKLIKIHGLHIYHIYNHVLLLCAFIFVCIPVISSKTYIELHNQ